MFNYNRRWDDELDNELKIGLLAGWSASRIGSAIGKTRGQVLYRAKTVDPSTLKNVTPVGCKPKNNVGGGIDYASNLKFGG